MSPLHAMEKKVFCQGKSTSTESGWWNRSRNRHVRSLRELSGSPVDGRPRWLRVSGAEAFLPAALVNTSLWAEDFQETDDEPVCKKLYRHLPVCALLLVQLELQCVEKLEQV